MATQLSIISSCAINGNTIVKNGDVIFSSGTESIQAFLLQVYNFLAPNYPKFYKMDNLSKLGWLASEVLLKDAVIDKSDPQAVSIVLLNANASLDTDIKYYNTVNDIASPALFVYTLPNIMIGEIDIRNNFQGENALFVFEEFNSVFLQRYVSNLIDSGKATYCICGWVDVLEEEYKAVLFLVTAAVKGIAFTQDNMQKIFDGKAI